MKNLKSLKVVTPKRERFDYIKINKKEVKPGIRKRFSSVSVTVVEHRSGENRLVIERHNS